LPYHQAHFQKRAAKSESTLGKKRRRQRESVSKKVEGIVEQSSAGKALQVCDMVRPESHSSAVLNGAAFVVPTSCSQRVLSVSPAFSQVFSNIFQHPHCL
jgi:hypothetical protein